MTEYNIVTDEGLEYIAEVYEDTRIMLKYKWYNRILEWLFPRSYFIGRHIGVGW